MKPLLLLLLAAVGSAGLTFWQQQSINRVRAKSAFLSEQLLRTRSSLEAEQTSLDSARSRMKQLEAELQTLKQERSTLASAPALQLPTPEQEGWWPAKRPYFYLAKKYLTQMRFDSRPVVGSLLTTTNTDNPLATGDYFWLMYQPFSDAELNPHLAMLLGMSDEEVSSVNDLYGEFVRNVRAVEAAHIQRVDPPEPDGDYGRFIVARMPALTTETRPLLEHWEQTLDQMLGPTRSGILREHAKRHFEENLDRLGSEPREFLRTGFNLWIRFTSKWGSHMGGAAHLIYDSQDWDYGYLFGPGAPCELKSP